VLGWFKAQSWLKKVVDFQSSTPTILINLLFLEDELVLKAFMLLIILFFDFLCPCETALFRVKILRSNHKIIGWLSMSSELYLRKWASKCKVNLKLFTSCFGKRYGFWQKTLLRLDLRRYDAKKIYFHATESYHILVRRNWQKLHGASFTDYHVFNCDNLLDDQSLFAECSKLGFLSFCATALSTGVYPLEQTYYMVARCRPCDLCHGCSDMTISACDW